MTDQTPTEYIFAPLKSFSWSTEDLNGNERLVAVYYPGNTYNCTRFPVHDALREKLGEWLEAGLIEAVPLEPGTKFVMTTPGG